LDHQKKTKKLIFLQLNELNFDLIEKYCKKYDLKNFNKLLCCKKVRTTSENVYEKLEPWIQWTSVYSGLSADEHKIFRLGDTKNAKNLEYIFEKVEKKNFKVGCISPFNVVNNLKNPSYFISDPWTQTSSDGSFWSRLISDLAIKTINDNAKGKISIKHYFVIILLVLKFVRIKKISILGYIILQSFYKKWMKALVLDYLLNEIHLNLFYKKKPNLSSLFLNAGAHTQHHYLFFSEFSNNDFKEKLDWYLNSKYDPIYDLLKVYDSILDDYINNNTDLIIHTGLTQIPNDMIKYYYRLRDHNNFIKLFKFNFKRIIPRMSRDFLIEFNNKKDAFVAEKTLKEIVNISNNERIFNVVDNRGKSIFVTLTYPNKISNETKIKVGKKYINLISHVVFAAIKNGIHDEHGFIFLKGNITNFSPINDDHVKKIYYTIANFFNENA